MRKRGVWITSKYCVYACSYVICVIVTLKLLLEIIVLSCTFFFPCQKIVVLAVDFELGSGLLSTMLHYLQSAS